MTKKNSIKRLLSLLAALLLVFALFSGCNRDPDDDDDADIVTGYGVEDPDEDVTTFDKYPTLENGDITIIYFEDYNAYAIKKAKDPNYFDAVLEAIPKFEEKYNGKVNLIYKPWNDMQTHLTELVNANDAPDLAVVYDRTFTPSVESNLIQNISPYVGKLDYSFWDVDTSLFSWKKSIYAIPIRPFPFYILFNRDLFDNNNLESPDELWKKGEWTFDKFEEVGKKLTVVEDGQFTQFGFGSYRETITNMLVANGGSIIEIDSENGKVKNGLLNQKSKTALDYLSRWIPVSTGFMAFTTDDFDVADSFESGNCAMIRLYEYPIVGFEPAFEVGLVPFPSGPDMAGKKVNFVYPQAFAVPTGAKNVEGGIAFMYMVNQIQATDGVKGDKLRFGEEYYNMVYGEDIVNVYAYDKAPTDIDTIVATMNNELFDGVPPATIIDSISPQIDAAIEKMWGAKVMD